jgi:hypothetical protein
MKRYGIGEMGPHLRPCMQEKTDGPWVRWEDVRAFILDLETGNCTKCHGEKKTQGGVLCMRCRMETL